MRFGRHFWWIAGSLIMVGGIGLTIASYRFDWSVTGFPNKTLWDWMQLLIVPVVLAVGALLFNFAVNRNEQKIADQRYQNDQKIVTQRAQIEREIALDNQQETLLQTYLDRMSDLMLNNHLRKSALKDEVQQIARARTLTVLPRLDAHRKGSLIKFLYESDLISAIEKTCVIDLKDADLSKVNLKGYILKGINLSGANLVEANLQDAFLDGANLSGANLSGADLNRTSLNKVNFGLIHVVEMETIDKIPIIQVRATNLSRTNLKEASLRGTVLYGAILEDVDLTRTNLEEADLTGAYINRSLLTQKQLATYRTINDL